MLFTIRQWNFNGVSPFELLGIVDTMRHNKQECPNMANLNIEIPDDLAQTLEGIATAQHISVQQLALEKLISLAEDAGAPRAGSPAAVLRAMREPPHSSSDDVRELDAAIAAGRLPVRGRDLFAD